MPTTFRADFGGIGQMLTSPWMRAEMERRAKAVEELARADAPVDETGPHPGQYRDSIQMRTFVRERPARGGVGRRVVARVEATAPESFIVEYGTRRQEAHHTLGRALDAAAH